jgi:hypothetical protein
MAAARRAAVDRQEPAAVVTAPVPCPTCCEKISYIKNCSDTILPSFFYPNPTQIAIVVLAAVHRAYNPMTL